MIDIRQIEKRLRRAIQRKRLVLILAGCMALCTTALGLLLILSCLAALFVIPVPVKIVLLIGSLALEAYAFYRYLYSPVRTGSHMIDAALEIEKGHPDIKGRLVAALQFPDLDLTKTNVSPVLIDLTARQAEALTRGIDFNEIVSGYPLLRRLKPAVPVLVLTLIVGFLIPGIFSKAIEVYSRPLSLVAPPPGFSLVVTPKNAQRVKYSDIQIGGALIGSGFADQVEIYYRFAEGRWQSEKLNLLNTKRFTITQGDSLPFGVTLKQVRRSFDYYIVAGAIRSETYAVDVVDRPRVTNLRVVINYPAYTGLEPLRLDENNGSFAALVGSRAAIEVEANRTVAQGDLVLNDSSLVKLTWTEARGVGDLTILNDLSYHVHLRDAQGEENPDPIEYVVTAVPDEYPTIQVAAPGYDLNLDESMLIPFSLHIADDFGFTSLVLKYQIVSGGRKGEENVAVINFSDKIAREGDVSFQWDVDGFGLFPADYILYHFELADNDRVSGPKVTSTRVYAARLPSIDEIVSAAEMDQEGRVTEAERILQEQRETAEKLQQLAQQMKSSENLDWQQQKDLENIVKQQQMTADKLEELARKMEESVQQMEKNNLLSEQIVQKMQELQKLFNEVATPEMKEAMKKLAEALKKMTPEEIKEAMKNFQLSQQEMLSRLERSVDLLRRMRVQQKMTALLKMAEEILLEQNRVNSDAEESKSPEDHPRLAQREQQLADQMPVLKEEAGKLEEILADSPYKDSEPHHRFAQVIKDNQAAGDMQAMQSSLSGNRKEAALQQGQEASQKLHAMVSELRDIMVKLTEDEGRRLAQQIRRTIDDANYLSQKQEELYGNCQSNMYQPQQLGEMAAQQQMLRESVGGLNQRIEELTKQSPFLAAEIRSFLEQSQAQMQGSCTNLGERRGRASLNQQREAIYNLNRASVKLLDALESQKQCNKGGSCNKMSQQMESLCQKQNDINQKTKGQCPNPGQTLSPTQREGLQRLAGEQGVVRKSLQELQAEFGDRREILGRLDALAEEARQVEEMLDDGRTGQDLFDRQVRIYSRMLDIQKSLNRRDYTQDRKATSAEDILRASPGPLDQSGLQQTETLQDRLNRYLQEGYPRQYEQQIKAYFKAVSGMGQNGAEK